MCSPCSEVSMSRLLPLSLLFIGGLAACEPEKAGDDSGWAGDDGEDGTDGTDGEDGTDGDGGTDGGDGADGGDGGDGEDGTDGGDECDVTVSVYDYDDQDGWIDGAPDCGGSRQSPVDIVTDDVVEGETPVLVFDYGQTPLHVIHNGHSIEFEVAEGAASLDIDGEAWSLVQFHFHTPSEHTINGENLPGEMHLVHTKGDEIAVVGIFLVEEEESDWLARAAWTELPTEAGECFESEETIDLGGLIDGGLATDFGDFVHYEGSLTTPPCSEGVQWFVHGDFIAASTGQLAELTARFDGNNRDTQPGNDRALVYGVFGE